MQDLSLFTYKEAIDMINGFFMTDGGILDSEVKQYLGASRFIGMGYAQKDEEHEEFYVVNDAGRKLLREYVKSISERFIDYMKTNRNKVACEDIFKWFMDEFDLDTIEDGEDIAKYIFGKLGRYGYKIWKPLGRNNGFYEMEPATTEY